MEGKVAIVTGANSGIGQAISLKFASLGASVTLCGRDPERLRSVRDKVIEIRDGDRNKVLIVQGDVSDESIRREIIEKTVEKFGRLDILVINAAVTGSRQFVSTATEETYNVIMDTNLKSAFFLIQLAVPYLEKSNGNIINVSSNATSVVDSRKTIYTISKVALEYLTKLVAAELGPKGIRVNSVNPGFIATRLLRFLGDKTEPMNNAVENIEFNQQALKARPLMLKDVVEAVVFLVSDAAGMITGEQLYIDGGRRFFGHANWAINKPKL